MGHNSGLPPVLPEQPRKAASTGAPPVLPDSEYRRVRKSSRKIADKLAPPLAGSAQAFQLSDWLSLWGLVAKSVGEFSASGVQDDLYSALFSQPVERDRLEEALRKRMKNADPSRVGELADVLLQQVRRPRSARSLLIHAIKEFVPPGKRGRKAKIANAELSRFASLSDQLLPPVRVLLSNYRQRPEAEMADMVSALTKRWPSESGYIRAHLACLQSALQNQRLLRECPTHGRQSRLLADVLAGDQYGLSPSYAFKKAKAVRRDLRRSLAGPS